MYFKIAPILLNSLALVAENLKSALKDVGDTITDLIKFGVNNLIIPIAAIIIIIRILFVIISVAKSKSKRDGEGIEEHVLELFVEVIVLVLILGYGAFAWGIV